MRPVAALSAALVMPALLLAVPSSADAQDPDPDAPSPAASPGEDESSAGNAEQVAESEGAAQANVVGDPRETERQVAMRAHNSLLGTVGGLHVVDAGSGPKGSFRVSLTGYWMTKQDFLLLDDQNDLGGGSLAVSVTADDWLELSVAATARSFNNTGNLESPGLLQTIGDVHAGLKGFHEVVPGLTVGGDVVVSFLSGLDGIGKDFGATSARLRYNTSLDLRTLSPRPLPMRLRFNLGYYFDNSARIVDGVEQTRLDALQAERGPVDPEFQHLINRAERFGLQINRSDMLNIALGGDWPLHTKKAVVTPLLEWVWGIPINRQGFTCPYPRGDDGNKLPGVDSCLSDEGPETWPSTLTVGTSVQPKKAAGLTLTAAVDVGLSGTSTFVQELAPNAPYTVYFGAGYAIDPRPDVVVEKVEVPVEVEAEPEPTARVLGTVVNAETRAPIAQAIVHFEGMDVSDLATDDDGQFVSYPLAPGTHVTLQVTAPDYQAGTCETTLAEQEVSDVELTCELTAEPRIGNVEGRVVDGEGRPLAGERVVLRGPVQRETQTDTTGEFALRDLPVGHYTARVEDEAHLIKVVPFQVHKGHTTGVELSLRKKPPRPNVVRRGDTLRLRQPVTFTEGTAQLEPRSEAVLAELADLLMRTPEIELVEVQGHLDPSSDTEHDQRLSQQRADAVREWLVAHGVRAERVAAKGYGSEQPLRPNVTGQNRARNRRIQVVIPQPADATP